MRYQELAPGPRLGAWVQCFWFLEGAGPADDPQRIFPDGSMELVFHLGDPFARLREDGRQERQATSLAVGQMLGCIELQPSERVDVVGIRFRPGGARPWLPMPQHELTGAVAPLTDLWGRFADELRERLASASGPRARARLLESMLLARAGALPPPDALDQAIGRVVAQRGLCSLDTLRGHAGMGARRLERAFAARVGIGPKLFLRILRFQQALGEVERGGGRPWLDLALDCGYYDQSHFIRDFREFSGLTPSLYFRQEPGLSAYFTRSPQEAGVAFFQDRERPVP